MLKKKERALAYCSPLSDRSESPPILTEENLLYFTFFQILIFLPPGYIVLRLAVSGQIDGPGGDVDIHNPVNYFRLEVAFVLVDYELLTGVEQFYKCYRRPSK